MMSRIVLLFGLACALLCPPATAAIDDAEAMNLSGMQRMLSQRIAKSYLMIGAEVRSDQALQQLDQSVARFESNYQALVEYAPSAEIHAALAQVGQSWQHYRELALSKGFLEAVSGPLVRSSYRAERVLEQDNVGLESTADARKETILDAIRESSATMQSLRC